MMMSSLLINKRHTGMGKYVDINVGMYEKYGLYFVRDLNKLRVPFVRTRKSYGFHSDKIRRIYGFSKYVTRNVMGSGSYGLRVNSGRVQNGSGSDTGCGALLSHHPGYTPAKVILPRRPPGGAYGKTIWVHDHQATFRYPSGQQRRMGPQAMVLLQHWCM